MELRPWTLPNLLTFARLVALPFLINAIIEGEHAQAFAIFFAMAVSDFVDGYLARHFGMASPLGALLDPIADKLFLVSTFIVYALRSTPTNIHIPLWLVLMTVGRDVLIVAVALVMALGLGIKTFGGSRFKLVVAVEPADGFWRPEESVGGELRRRQHASQPPRGSARITEQLEVPVCCPEDVRDPTEGQQATIGVGPFGEPPDHDGQQLTLNGCPTRDSLSQRTDVSDGASGIAIPDGGEPSHGGVRFKRRLIG